MMQPHAPRATGLRLGDPHDDVRPIRWGCGVKRGGVLHTLTGISRGVKRTKCGVNRRESDLSRGVKRQTQLIEIK
jgi:hypothetical protein